MKQQTKIEPQSFLGVSGEIEAHLFTQMNSLGKLAVVLPGAGYSFREPLLKYSIQILLKKQFRVLALDKVYGEDPKWRSLKSEDEARKVVEDDTIQVFKQIQNKFVEPIELLLGRSLGTYAIACLLEKEIVKPKKIVWQTPALGNKWLTMRDCAIPGFGIVGTADYYYQQVIENLPKDRIIIENADHGMEIPGDPVQSIEVLRKVILATEEWL